MLSHMTNKQSQTHLTLTSGAPVALIVNNLGGTSVIEMNIVAREAIQQFGDYTKSREFTENNIFKENNIHCSERSDRSDVYQRSFWFRVILLQDHSEMLLSDKGFRLHL